jgi:hypothetical protein
MGRRGKDHAALRVLDAVLDDVGAESIVETREGKGVRGASLRDILPLCANRTRQPVIAPTPSRRCSKTYPACSRTKSQR